MNELIKHADQLLNHFHSLRNNQIYFLFQAINELIVVTVLNP